MKSNINHSVFGTKRRGHLVVIVGSLLVLALIPIVVIDAYLRHLLIMTYIAAALGMTFSLLYSTGLITLGAAAFYAIGAYASTILTMKLDLPFWASLPIVIALTAAVALGLGAIIVQKPGISFIIITLLFADVIYQFVGQVPFFGGWGGIVNIPPPGSVGPIVFNNKLSFYYLMLSFLAIIVLCFYALYTSRIGRAWKAIRLSPELAETTGIYLFRYRLIAFIVAGCSASLVGSFYAHYFAAISPDSFGGFTSIYIQLYSVLGGLEYYLLGPAIGSFIMVFAPEVLRFSKEFEPIITGLILLIIVLFFPGGIVGTILRVPSFRMQDLAKRYRMYLLKLMNINRNTYGR